MSPKLTVGARLRRRRTQDLKLSLRDCAAAAKLSTTHLHSLEQGGDDAALGLRYETLRRVAVAYQINLVDLLQLLEEALNRKSRRRRRPSAPTLKPDDAKD